LFLCLENINDMKHSLKKGISFGLTSGVITTIGLIVGLNAGTGSQLAILGGVLTIAIADSFSDALGIHVSEESEGKHTQKEIWEATISTFFTKLLFASSFILPILLFPLTTAVIICVAWGLFILVLSSIYIAKQQKSNVYSVVFEHVLISIAVIIITQLVGKLISGYFDTI
jgi:vacuolar iron transporter family protein